MSAGVTIVREALHIPQQDTTRSWRVVHKVVIWGCSGITAILGFVASYSKASRGDSDERLAEFEASLKEYLRAATQAGCYRVSGVDFACYYVEIPATADLADQGTRLAGAVNALSYENKDRAKATLNQAVAEYNFSRTSDYADVRVHSDASLRALNRDWEKKNTTQATMKGLMVAAISGAAAWVVAWLLVVGLALLWWFMMDRLRDISRAIKGY